MSTRPVDRPTSIRLAYVVLGLSVEIAACAQPARDGGDGWSGPIPADPAANGDGGTSEGSMQEEEDDDDDRLDLGGGTGSASDGEQPCEQDVDIVFVMDVTSSMGELIESLIASLPSVDAAVQALDLPAPPRYGLVVFADDHALRNGGAAYGDLASLEAELAEWVEFTQGDDQIGGGEPNYSYPENSLDALYATTAFDWRPVETTTRIVIHTTDDTFWDGPGEFHGHFVAHGYAETVEALREHGIRVFAFAAHQGGECECEDVSAGWSSPYAGQPSIPDGTDGGVFDILRVLDGEIALGDAIPQAVADSVCTPYEPVG